MPMEALGRLASRQRTIPAWRVRAAGVCRRSHSSVLDDKFSEWGESPYYSVGSKDHELAELLTHLYVL